MIKKNADFNRSTQNVHNISEKKNLFEATQRQINDNKWKLSPYPVSVTGAGVCWRMLCLKSWILKHTDKYTTFIYHHLIVR